ncbi:solute carrier organic anion transporter family member 2B1-like [Haliotis rubra]|uniref:solute carrier organic anion transporter family member 2B1-like n=1 Tax=Haliotis rubra TaxID=36100 RepID=UPI001EE5BD44|nr:solute carrier organic anion transporter family member 2B1-like [Haliotis rubra]XP_046584316.1 solute carrier organic anion transporter family member 2B1-like [Haliotis rubra]
MTTTQKMDDAKPADDKEVFQSHCGAGSCRPQALQCFKNVLSFSIFYGMAAMITQSLSVYIVSQVTALEKQFNMNSTTTGIILSCNDIGFLCTVLFVSHYGSYRHIPRIISLSTILFGVSGILASLCHFFDPYHLPKLSTENVRNSSLDQSFMAPLCDPSNTTSDGCGEEGVTTDTGSAQWIVWLLGFSMVLQGIGKSPRTSLSTTYMDDNNPIKTKTGLYIGISMTMTLFGPAMAVGLGGVFRTIPVDLQDTLLTPRHPKWIGAWWIGFLLFGCLGVVVGIPLLFFPKQIVPTTEKQSSKEDAPAKEKIKELPRSMFRVLKSPIYRLSLVGVLFLLFLVGGSQSFTSKYVEKQFMVPASKTNIILGVQSLISATVGTFTGGLLTSRLKLTRAGCLKFTLFTLIVALLCNVIMFFLGCDTPKIHGFHDKEGIITFDDGIRVCSCDSTSYFPVCGDDGMTYFSPCFAGCTNQTLSMYGGCSKVTSGQTTAGMCVSDCPYFYYYIAVDMIQKLIATMSIMPIYMTLIRSVEGRDKATAFGLFSFLASLLGFLPAPIVFGFIIDSTCLIWETSCGVRGSCGQYDLESLRVRLKATECAFRVASLIFFSIAFIVLKLQGYDKPTDETLECAAGKDKKMESSAM